MDDFAVDDNDVANPDSDKIYLHEGMSSDRKGMRELESTMEVLNRVDLELAYSSEKLVNLDILLMHLSAWENNYEATVVENDHLSVDSIENALVFDLLSGYLDSEVRELDNFMHSLQAEIFDARQKESSCTHLRELFSVMKGKLHDSEKSLKHSQEQVLEIKMQSAKFQRAFLAFGHKDCKNDKGMGFSENGQFSNINVKSKIQTAEQQRHVLRMLEKALARELDLEKKLSELRQNEENLKLKLHLTEQVAFCMEEEAEVGLGKFFEAENAAEVLMGISKELVGRLQIVQFKLNGSIQREGEAEYKLQDCMEQLKVKETAFQKLESSNAKPYIFQPAQTTSLKGNFVKVEAKDKSITDNYEVFTLREKVKLLEEQLKESEVRLENANASNEASEELIREMENIIESLKESFSKADIRAESAEAKLTLLTETNLELTEELGFLKGSSDTKTEKVSLLEKQLRELEIQLKHAKASSEASQEQQNMLYAAIWDMETLIEDLKSKVSKAESKIESAEEQCLISETNLELDKELSLVRARMECSETSLHQANVAKEASAQDINMSTKLIMDMVVQLAIERERIQKQLYSLTKENKVLVEKFRKTKNDASVIMCNNGDGDNKGCLFSQHDSTNANCTKTSEELVTESSATCFQVDEPSKDAPVCENEVGTSISANDSVGVVSKLEAVRMVEAGQLNLMYVFMSILVLLLSVLAIYLFSQETCPL